MPGVRALRLKNYPNPFNPVTIIEYYIPGDNRVTVKIYDVSGKLIKDLLSGHQEKGKHQQQEY